jgi:hypothetical protein
LYINNLDGQLAKLLELFVKFKNISLIKNGGSQEILNLFRLNIMWMTQKAKDTFTEFSQLIMRNIELFKAKTRNRYDRPLAKSITKEDINNVEAYFDFVIGLIRLLVTTFNKNTNTTTNFELEEVKKLFDIMIDQYLNYLHILGTNTAYLPPDFQISNILSKRQLNSVSNYTNQKKKLKNTFFPNIQRVESLLSKNVIMNVLQKIKGSFNAGLTQNQIQLKIKSLQQFKEKIKNSPLLQDADIKKLLTQINNTVRTNQNTQQRISLENPGISNKYYSTNRKTMMPVTRPRNLLSPDNKFKFSLNNQNNSIQKKKNYNRIVNRLEKKYSKIVGSVVLSTLAEIESQIESIRRMNPGNNRNNKIIKLKKFIEPFRNMYESTYPDEFKEYNYYIESISPQIIYE